jgi:ribosomal protein S18 acetylase RimI-like enzyme
MMTVEELRTVHHPQILAIVRQLPEWFDEQARDVGIPIDIQVHKGYVAMRDDEIIGFATFSTEYGAGRLSWIAVHRNHHRQGIGKALVKAIEETLAGIGVSKIWVETVGWSEPPSESYARTCAFYISLGYQKTAESEVYEVNGRAWRMYDFYKPLR